VSGARLSRRQVLVGSLLGSGSFIAASALAQDRFGKIPWIPGSSPAPKGIDGARFFSPSERRCVDALIGRLIPSDDAGPGAREAGVLDFIDNQLSGSFGRGERWYMQGPFSDGLKTQGYQQPHSPAQLYRVAIAALDDYCRERFEGQTFADLPEGEQDSILALIEEEQLAFDTAPASAFFEMVLDNTIEGFFCDPIYGGNRDMVGWKLVGFPGVRYDYRDYLDHDGEALSFEPVGLKGRSAWNAD
jgi:gluconate 2-dehydrogenase gamma chain